MSGISAPASPCSGADAIGGNRQNNPAKIMHNSPRIDGEHSGERPSRGYNLADAPQGAFQRSGRHINEHIKCDVFLAYDSIMQYRSSVLENMLIERVDGHSNSLLRPSKQYSIVQIAGIENSPSKGVAALPKTTLVFSTHQDTRPERICQIQ